MERVGGEHLPGMSVFELSRSLRQAAREVGITGWHAFRMIHRPRICPFLTVLERVGIGSRVVDYGCGEGALSALIARYRGPASLTGVELDAAKIQIAQRVYKGERFPLDSRVLRPNMAEVALRSADLVLLVDVLHHIPFNEQEAFLQELFRKTSSGTRWIVKDMNASHVWRTKWNRLHDRVLNGGGGGELSLEDCKQALSQLGLRVVLTKEIEGWLYSHYLVEAIKP